MMRKMLYVGIVLIPAAVLTWWAIHLARTSSGFLWIAPAVIAVALCLVVVCLVRVKSSASSGNSGNDRALTANLKRWLKVQTDEKRDADKSTRATHSSSRL